MLEFPLYYDPEPQECYNYLLHLLHSNKLKCPNRHSLHECYVYKRSRNPILDYRCKTCGKCFNIFTGTILKGTQYNVKTVVLYIDGIISAKSIAQISRDIGVGRKGLTANKSKFQILVENAKSFKPEYVNWDKALQRIDLSKIRPAYDMKGFINKLTHNEPHFLYWEAFLNNIEDWEIETSHGEKEKTRLVLKLRRAGCFALTKMLYSSINPKTGKKEKKEKIKIYKLSPTYLKDKRRIRY